VTVKNGTVNDKAVIDYIKILFQYLPWRTEEDHVTSQNR